MTILNLQQAFPALEHPEAQEDEEKRRGGHEDTVLEDEREPLGRVEIAGRLEGVPHNGGTG